MGWLRWLESRHTCPRYICNCTCDGKSSENSLFDFWSFAHILWGVLYSIPGFYIDSLLLSFFITVSLAILYEFAENGALGRRVAAFICCSELYDGDNFWNSVCDVLCCVLGWLLASTVHMFTNVHYS